MLAAVLALSLSAHAAPDSGTVLAALRSTSGWGSTSQSKGVTVTTKQISGLDVPAYRGVRTVDVSCDAYFGAVTNIAGHTKVSDLLRTSTVVSKSGSKVVFYQVADLPLISDRFWINEATNAYNIGGVQGHHSQQWQQADLGAHAALKAEIEAKYDAVYTPVNYGYWDLVPAGPSSCTVTYAVVSDPGGSVPSGAGSWASGKSLPDNINNFLAASR